MRCITIICKLKCLLNLFYCKFNLFAGFDSWVGKIPRSRKWQPTPVLLPVESHGQKNSVGYSPRGHTESDTTGRLTLALFHKHVYIAGKACERMGGPLCA